MFQKNTRCTSLLLDNLPLPAWGTTDNLPREFALFYYGANRTTKGIVYLTEHSAQRCLSTWKEYGNDLAGDYEHAAANNANGDPVPASCWFKLGLRHNGLYAVDVDWTARGAALLKAKEYKYYSPFFFMELGDDGKWYVTEIINVALTNQPATKNQRPLVASRGLRIKRKHSMVMFSQDQIDQLKKLLVGGGVKDDATAADLILQMMPIVCTDDETPEPIAPADNPLPMADPIKPEDKPMEMSDVAQEYKDQLKAANARLAVLEAKDREREKLARDEVFAEFKRTGRLRLTTDVKARAILEKYGIEVFKETYSSVAPLTDTKPPAAPATPPAAQVVQLNNQGRNNNVERNTLTDYIPTTAEIADYQNKHKVGPSQAMTALRKARVEGNAPAQLPAK